MLNNEKLIFVDIRPDHYQLVLVFMTHIKLSVAYKCTIKIKLGLLRSGCGMLKYIVGIKIEYFIADINQNFQAE